jgi:flagellin-like hook-associated protein FlgL
MRITFTTVNRNVQRNLSRRYSDMVGLQEQLATGKRLRKPSDDPVDVANTIKLRAKETQLGQYKRNIQDGLAIMGVASSAMASMNELLHRARELAVQAANGTYTDSDRLYMQQEVDQLYRQMMSVVNTQFKGTYIFNGTNGNIPPYKIASSESGRTDYEINRNMATFGIQFEYGANYQPDVGITTGASHAATVPNADALYLKYATNNLRIGDTVQLAWQSGAVPPNPSVNGRDLQYIYPETFPLEDLWVGNPPEKFSNGTVNSAFTSADNITFGVPTQIFNSIPAGSTPMPTRNITAGTFTVIADAGFGPVTLSEGSDYRVNYATGTFTLMNNAYNGADFDMKYRMDGYNGDYEVDYVTGQVSILSEKLRIALNEIPNADRPTQTAIGSAVYNPVPPLPNAQDGLTYRLDNVFQISGGKFGDPITNIFPGSMTIKIGNREYVEGHGKYQPDYYDENGVLQKGKNNYDYEVDYETGMITVYNTDLLRDMRPDWLGGPDPHDPNSPVNMYRPNQLQMNFDYITRGVDIYGDMVTSAGEIYRAIEEGIVVPINVSAAGLLKDVASGNEMVGVLLRYSQSLLKDDRDGIQSALDELTTMYDAVLNSQSEMGAKIYRFELTEQRNGEQTIEVSAQASSLADADLAEVISRLLLAENVYNAALQAAMRVLQPSLANYM